MDPRTCLKMILAVIGAVCLVYSVICWVLHWIFSRRKNLVGGVSGFLKQKKYKKDQVLFSPGGSHSAAKVYHIKHQTTGTYEYVVNNKTYKKRHIEYIPKGEMPKLLSIRYLKKFPWIACEKDSCHFDLHALFSFFLAAVFFLIAFC